MTTCLSSTQPASDGSFDLAVGVDPDAEMCRQAYQDLCPGGAFYSEWYSWGKGSSAIAEKTLETTGFEQVSLYQTWPSPQHNLPSFWLPVNAPAALDYFLEHRPYEKSLWRRYGRRILRSKHARRVALGLVRPICAVATKPFSSNSPVEASSAQASEPQNDWLRGVLSENGVIDSKQRPNLTRLLLTGGKRSINKPVMLVFQGRDATPLCAIKFARVPASMPGLRRELAALRAVETATNVTGAPRALFSYESHASLAIGEGVVDGSPLYSTLSDRNFQELALQGANWLLGLVRNESLCPQAEWWPRLVQPGIDDFSRSFGPVIQPNLIARIEEELRQLPSLPRAIEHRDFSPWNVLLTSAGQMRVLDWESAEPNGLAGPDLIYFLTFLTLFHDKATTTGAIRSYRSMLDPDSTTGRVFARCVSVYGDRVGIAGQYWRTLRIMTWLIHSSSEYARMQADLGRPPMAEELRSSMFLNFLIEDLEQVPH